MKIFFVFLAFTLGASFPVLAGNFGSAAASFKGFIQVAPQRELYVDYVKAQPGQPTVILLNGLTYSTVQWEQMVQPLLKKGVGVVRYDMVGMGQTLLKYAPIIDVIPYENQITDLKVLLTKMSLPAPYNFVGLSYGGGIALGYALRFPGDVKNIIAMAPYTEKIPAQAAWIYQQIQLTREMYPFNPASDAELYDYFLRELVYATYPTAEPIVLENPFKLEATYRLAQGITSFTPVDHAMNLPPHSLHLMVARQDQYIPAAILEKFWQAVPVSARASRIVVNDTEHKMPQAVPAFAAAWIYEIIAGHNDLLPRGLDFEGFPLKKEVRQNGQVIPWSSN